MNAHSKMNHFAGIDPKNPRQMMQAVTRTVANYGMDDDSLTQAMVERLEQAGHLPTSEMSREFINNPENRMAVELGFVIDELHRPEIFKSSRL